MIPWTLEFLTPWNLKTTLDKIEKRIINILLGGHIIWVIPVTIPNTEVKPIRADGIAFWGERVGRCRAFFSRKNRKEN